MLGLLPLAGFLLLSGDFGAHATVVAEGRVGQAPFQGYRDDPLQSSTDPRASAMGIITPIGDATYEGARGQVIIDYGPRILWRRPNPFYNNAPLVLHVANLSATADATRTLRLIERASFSYGKADYQALSQIVPTNGQLPSVLDVLVLSAGTGLRWDAGYAWRYETMLNVEHRRTLGSVSDMEVSAMAKFRQTNLFLDSSAIARVSRRHDLVLSLGVSDRFLDSDTIHDVELVSVTPQVGWRSRLNWSTEVRALAGATYVRDRGSTALLGTSGVLRPVGSAEVDGVLFSRHGVSWQGMFGTTFDYFVDPFLNAIGPRALVTTRTQVLFQPAWSVGLEGTFSSSLRGEPIKSNPLADETLAELVLPARHRLSNNMIIETGLRWLVRAPRIRADNLVFHERQTWLYVAFTATTRRLERWVGPQPQETSGREEGVFTRPPPVDAPSSEVPVGISLPGQPDVNPNANVNANSLGIPAPVEPAVGSEPQ